MGQGMAVSSKYAYLASGNGGLHVMDVNDPAKPDYLTCAWASPAEDVALMGSYALVAGGDKGLIVYEVQQHLYPPLKPPVITGGMMTMTWPFMDGVCLQIATNLTSPVWLDVPGSEGTNTVTLPTADGSAYFRLAVSQTNGLPLSALWGPVMNPSNGHAYYLLQPGLSWLESEAAAQELGGHLAAINNAAENQWVYETFGMYAGVSRELFIGLTGVAVECTFVWLTGEPLVYSNWGEGEPNDWGGGEDGVSIMPAGDRASKWNDLWIDYVWPTGSAYEVCGVVEVAP